MNRLYVPHYANNLKERLLFFFNGTVSGLEEKQLYGVLLASAYSTKNESVINNIVNIARDYVDITTINAAKSAAALAEAKFDHKGMPYLESDIYVYTHNKGFVQAYDTPTTQTEINKKKQGNIDFQLYLLAASFINDFDNYIELLMQQKSVSIHAINTIMPIAATIQSLAEIIEYEDLSRTMN